MEKKLNSKEIIKRLEEKKKEVKKIGVKKIGLFGSYLNGEQKRGSDIDIIVSFDNMSYDSYFEILSFLRKLFNKEIDLVIGESLRPELNHIKRGAKYAKI